MVSLIRSAIGITLFSCIFSCAEIYKEAYHSSSKSDIFTCGNYVDKNQDGKAQPEEFTDRKSAFYEGGGSLYIVVHGVNLKDVEATLILRNSDGDVVFTVGYIFPTNDEYFVSHDRVSSWAEAVGYGVIRAELLAGGLLIKQLDFFINKK